jgi:hypothetical protein
VAVSLVGGNRIEFLSRARDEQKICLSAASSFANSSPSPPEAPVTMARLTLRS